MKKHLLCFITTIAVLYSSAQINNPEAEAIRITQMGDIYLKASEYDLAIYYYLQALEAYPGYVKTQYQLAQCYRLSKQFDSAAFHYQSIILNEQDIRYPITRYHLAMILLDRNEFEVARENLITFRSLLEQHKLQELKKYRDFYKQSLLEIDKLSTE